MNEDSVEIKVEGYRIVGGGSTLHAEYQLHLAPSYVTSSFVSSPSKSHEDQLQSQNWSVLRRYAEVNKSLHYLYSLDQLIY